MRQYQRTATLILTSVAESDNTMAIKGIREIRKLTVGIAAVVGLQAWYETFLPNRINGEYRKALPAVDAHRHGQIVLEIHVNRYDYHPNLK